MALNVCLYYYSYKTELPELDFKIFVYVFYDPCFWKIKM